jgi:hypothetical protein
MREKEIILNDKKYIINSLESWQIYAHALQRHLAIEEYNETGDYPPLDIGIEENWSDKQYKEYLGIK